MTNTVDDSTFESLVLHSELPVLVDFWAPWCGPCRAIAPVVSDVAEEAEGRFSVFKMNVDESPKTAAQYGIRSIPTLIAFVDGKPAVTSTGVKTKEEILGMMNSIEK